jgi:hypothetical protein
MIYKIGRAMSEEIIALKTQIGFLESDIDRFGREARERDKVINELYKRVNELELTVKQLDAHTPNYGLTLSSPAGLSLDDSRTLDARPGEMKDPTLDQ